MYIPVYVVVQPYNNVCCINAVCCVLAVCRIPAVCHIAAVCCILTVCCILVVCCIAAVCRIAAVRMSYCSCMPYSSYMFQFTQCPTQYVQGMGMKGNYQFFDVFGLDPELLAMVPQPAIALLLLFPITENVSLHM